MSDNSRVIKFRCWDKDKRKMLMPDNQEYYFINGELYVGETIEYGTHEKFNHFQLMQFTGLQDKNGKEIYHGDIVLSRGFKAEVIWQKYICKFMLQELSESRRYLDWFEYDYMQKDGEIIGNIYEHPELLTQLSKKND